MTRRYVQTTIGTLRLEADDLALTGLYFEDAPGESCGGAHAVLDHAEREIVEYLAGERRNFTIPLAAEGTPFQKNVWAALSNIPFGETRSYSDIARVIGRPAAVRAVGASNGRNPISIIVPCHRVIGADQTLTGYGGGIERKRFLLRLEGAFPHAQRELLPALS